MTFSEIALILRWLVALWALGWLVLPVSARLFPFLPDRGLALGRITALAALSLLSFWGGTLHVLPLGVSAYLFIALPALLALGWRKASFRTEMAGSKRAFLISDTVFLLAFGIFLWVRLRHPGTSDLEKPMDMALISAAMRANWLPFENPWFAGQPFTNYYYFGPLMGALLARILATPPHFAYNLIQPAFCAFFLSATWSLCIALSKSQKIGLVAMLLVCVGGNLEPLRQITQTHKLWPLDWWTTSRVIMTALGGGTAGTINEYPAFTLLAGDLHAHFYALALAVAHFCVCLGILKAEQVRIRSSLIVLGAVLLGLFAITNTWDTPLYGLLWLGSAWLSRRNGDWKFCNTRALLCSFLVMPAVAWPYFHKFKSQVSGVVFNPWIPDLFSFVLLWGSWMLLAILIIGLEPASEKPDNEANFRKLLMGIGFGALIFPFLFYIRGVFGDGDYRHQDTVFKFGLQAWVLLGVGVACEAGVRIKAWLSDGKAFDRVLVGVASAAFLSVVSLAPITVAWTRSTRDAPRDIAGKIPLSLDAASYLPASDQAGIEWLRLNAQPGETVIEAVKVEDNGSLGGDYDPNFGRVSAFTGVPSILGWPQHVAGWGAPWEKVQLRGASIRGIHVDPGALGELRKLGATYFFLGALDPRPPAGPGLQEVWSSPGQETHIFRLTP